MSIHALAFGPHPDDVEICCGGLLIKLAEAGHKTAIADLTQGEMGTQGTVETRKAEADAAAKILGLSHRENLALPDGGIKDEPEQIAKVVEVIRRLKPEVILAPYWQGRHPDHVEGSNLITKSVFYAGLKNFQAKGEAFTTNQVLYYQMRYSFRPSFITDITGLAEKKMQAIQCYQSQVTRDGSGPQTLISFPLSLSSIDARDRYYGAMIGCMHAEPYLTRQIPRIDDPINHFRESPTKNALLYSGEL